MLRLHKIFLQDCRRKNVGVAGYGKAFCPARLEIRNKEVKATEGEIQWNYGIFIMKINRKQAGQ